MRAQRQRRPPGRSPAAAAEPVEVIEPAAAASRIRPAAEAAVAQIQSMNWTALQSSMSSQLLQNIKQRSERQWRMIAAAAAVLAFCGYVFRRDIKQRASEEAADCVEIKSSTRIQCARMRPFRRKAFCCASRTR